MFKAEIKSDVLKGLVNIISTLVDEVKFSVDPEGLSLKAVDSAHVAMMELRVGSGAFESYSADETEIGLDLDKVKSVLKLASSGDIITMEQDNDHGRLIFKVGNITRRMHLVDTSGMSDPKVPQLSLSAKIRIKVDELQQGIRASESISDHITLTAGPEGFELSCEGDTDSASLFVQKDKLESLPQHVPSGLFRESGQSHTRGNRRGYRVGQRLSDKHEIRHGRRQRSRRLPARPQDRERLMQVFG
jgi:proliferating cell nuclear antigen